MCGIAGFWDVQAATCAETLTATVNQMRDTLIHRGPDGADTWVDASSGIGLGHRRLAILDLTAHGSQPMHSASNRYVIIFNGEIYNHQELKQQLTAEGLAPNWHGHSDTEIMLAAFDAYGVEAALNKFVGMFAIVLWDKQEKLLYLMRDRIGEKPLYYGYRGNYLLFGSELKSLKAHFAWQQQLNGDAIEQFMQLNYIPAPNTIYDGIYKVEPGHFVVANAQKDLRTVAYWQLKDVINHNPRRKIAPTEAIDCLEAKLVQAVSLQMLADVPVGAFLSGGIDSSLIVALMQAQSRTPIKTFSIGFKEDAYNEAEFAKKIAQHLQTQHTELYLSPQQTQEIIPNMATFYDEPFADSSQLPTYIVAKLTREHVTVSLSGDGGDELFAGYNRYSWTTQLWRKIAFMPQPMRKILAGLIFKVSPKQWNKIFASINPLVPRKLRYANPGEKLHKVANICLANNLVEVYGKFLSQWENLAPGQIFSDLAQNLETKDFTEIMMYIDMMRYLPDDILVKVDRAGMAMSLETRMPFLDHRVIEYAWSLPLDLKICDKQSKWILRQILHKYVPKALYERPKMGFGVPIDAWMRGPLNAWAQDLLSKSSLNAHSLFDHREVAKKWQQHITGRGNWQHLLWNVLSFQAWFDAHG